MNDYNYQTIAQEGKAEYKDRGSKFIGYAFSVTDKEAFKEKMKEVKKQHEKASHHCFAYRLGTDGLEFRSSDNGEPSGSAGRPILGQIDRHEITDALVVVVRYFGGTLLGIRGLINAYKTAAADAIEAAPIIRKKIEDKYHLNFDYTQINTVMQIIKQNDCSILKQEMQLFCSMKIGIPLQQKQQCLAQIEEIPGLEVAQC